MNASRKGLLGTLVLALWVVLLVRTAPAQILPGADRQPEPVDPEEENIGGPAGDSARAKGAGRAAGGVLGPDYVLGPEDVLVIDVFNLPEMKQVVRVENDGTISVKLLGRVKAAGFTTTGLEKSLEQSWGKDFLQDPQVTVFVREPHSQPVSVIGTVDDPGVYQLTGHRTLIDMLSLAGGLNKRGNYPSGRYVYVTRKGGFGDLEPPEGMRAVGPDQVEIDLRQLLYSNQAGLNIEIKPFDIISVSKADVVYVVGAVKKPGGFVLEDRENVTALQALAMAQGFFGSPAKTTSRIIRRLPDGNVLEIPINLKKVMQGRADDPVLAANDILLIPDSTQKMAAKRSVEAAIGTISGLLVYGHF